ncbi:MAG TPA: thiamine-phosphate kinase [Terriglobales bacterium]
MPLPELKLISRVRRLAAQPAVGRSRSSRVGRVVAGMGDDCAILRIPADHDTLVTTDFSLEGVHFRRGWHPPDSVGHRCLARGLSDIAAMGGEPVAAFLSLALPARLPQKWVDEFFKGFQRLATQFNVELAGGDTAESREGVLADVVVIGSAPRGQAILRSGARPGDRIYVTGKLGGSAATLGILYSDAKARTSPRLFPRHYFPQPRINIGKILREKEIASSMIDLSDGLSTDLRHICGESRTGAEIWEKRIPRARVGNSPRKVSVDFALHGGEDYELLFTARQETRVPSSIADVRVTEIGLVTEDSKKILLRSRNSMRELPARGWEHFRQPSPHK